jgi:hypothetical protein
MGTPRSERALVAAFFGNRAKKDGFSAPRSQKVWEDLIRAAAAEFLLPGLHRRLNEIQLETPPDVDEFLVAVEGMNRERNERILDEAQSIARILNGMDIEPVFLKGAAYLVEEIYRDPGCRYLCDLDLLIPASQLGVAAEALEREGYQPDTSDRMASFRHHYPQLQRPQGSDGSGGAPVDLHHSVGQDLSRRLLGGDEILRDSRRVEWRGVRIRIPSPEHLVTHLILHSQIHHSYSERIWPPLRAMQDLAMLNRHFGRGLDWRSVRERFSVHGEDSTLSLHLLQVNRTLGMPLPFTIEQGWIGRARWKRRQALNRWPALRFIDPAYLGLSTLSRRVRLLRSVFVVPGGWKHATRMLLRRGFYRRLLAEIWLH